MNIKTIYFDESGFTGYDLLNEEQPIFAISSTDISPQNAEHILKTSFPKYQGDEFKFSNLWRSTNKQALINFSQNMAPHKESVFTWINQKKFTVLALMVDRLIEPYMTDAGYDFYADGFCWKYTNYIYFGLTEISKARLFDELVNDYQKFSRQPSSKELQKLQMKLEKTAKNLPKKDPAKIFIEQFSMGAKVFERYHQIETFKDTNETQFSAMIAIIAHWRKKHSEDFIAVHDAAANFLRRRDTWDRITNSNVPKQLHRGGDGSYVEFPLRVRQTISADSKYNYAIQLCDIMSGLASKVFNPNLPPEDRTFIDDVLQVGFGKLQYNGIRFQAIFPDKIPPRELTRPDVVDQMVEIVFGAHNKDRNKV